MLDYFIKFNLPDFNFFIYAFAFKFQYEVVQLNRKLVSDFVTHLINSYFHVWTGNPLYIFKNVRQFKKELCDRLTIFTLPMCFLHTFQKKF